MCNEKKGSCDRFRRVNIELQKAKGWQEDPAMEGMRLHDGECPPCDGRNVIKINASIDGPADTPYEGGTYQLTFGKKNCNFFTGLFYGPISHGLIPVPTGAPYYSSLPAFCYSTDPNFLLHPSPF